MPCLFREFEMQVRVEPAGSGFSVMYAVVGCRVQGGGLRI